MRILAVEDDEVLGEAICQRFTKMGHEPTRLESEALGLKVIGFLIILFILAFMLKTRAESLLNNLLCLLFSKCFSEYPR